MRTSLGVLILLLGTGGLGWYASKNNAVRVQDEIAKDAEAVVGSSGQGLNVTVKGRDIDVMGVAGSQAEKEAVLAQLNAVPGRRVVRDEVGVLPVADPFEFNADKTADMISYSGAVPSEDDRAKLAQSMGDAAKDLVLSGGAPDGWTQSVEAGLAALQPLDTGVLKVSNNTLTLNGVAKTPAERDQATAALSALGDGVTTEVTIDVLDDGNPLSLNVAASRAGGIASASGKLPSDVTLAALGTAFGADVPGEAMEQSSLPAAQPGWGDVAGAGLQSLALLETGTLDIQDTMVTLTGTGAPDAIAKAEEMMANLPEGYTVKTDLSIADDGAPFTAKVDYDGAAAMISGKIPANIDAPTISRMLDVDTNTDAVTQALIKDESGTWAGVLENGTTALEMLENGQLLMVDRNVTLSGLARTPDVGEKAAKAFGTLPDGYKLTTKFDYLDDGTPPTYTLDYGQGAGTQMAGKLPEGMDIAAVSKALGVGDIAGDAAPGLVGNADADLARMQALQSWMPQIAQMQIKTYDRDFDVSIKTIPGGDADGMRAALTDAFGDGAKVMVTGVPKPQEPKPAMNDLENCNQQGKDLLEENQVLYRTGSAEIDAKSERAIEAISAFVLKCVTDTSLKVEVGGYTDDQGDADFNMNLSQERANSVRNVLIERGVPADSIIAKGYGETRPIAPNDTPEGRAKNRRTTLEFSQ